MSARDKRVRGEGFTLVELMVALTIGGIVIGAMYSMGSTSTRNFQGQHQIANMQSSLRFAYMQLKRDIMRAGLHGFANARPLAQSVCNSQEVPIGLPGGPGWFAAVSSYRDNLSPSLVDPTGIGLNAPTPPARGFSHDEVTFVGNYATANQYPDITAISPNAVTLPYQPGQASHALQVDFGWDATDGAATPVINPAEVARAFPVGGLIRLYSRGKKHHIARLTSPPVFGAATITFNFAPRLGDCTTGDMEDGWIAPLQVIRYGVALSAPDSLDSDRVTGAAFAQLTRMRMDRLMTTVLESRPVLDYTATFNLAFTMTAPPPSDAKVADNYTIGQRASWTDVNSNPEHIRSVEVELGVRAPDVDQSMIWPCPEQACMALFPTTEAGSPAARVRVLRSEVFLPNLAYEGR